MKKLILLLILFAISFPADKWEYAIAVHTSIPKLDTPYGGTPAWSETENIKMEVFETFTVVMVKNKTDKYNFDSKRTYENSKAHEKETIEEMYNNYLIGMNVMGEDGWELMFKEKAADSITNFYFKRKIN